MKSRILLSVAAIALVAVPGLADAKPKPKSAKPAAKAAPAPSPYGRWGVDLSARDLSVRPGDDFQLYSTGHWLATHEIPADRPMTGTGLDVYEHTQANLRSLITNAPATSQYGMLYRDFMDTAKIEKVGDAPLKVDVARIMALPDKAAFTRDMASTGGRFGGSVEGFQVYADPANPAMNTIWVGSGGMGMPNRDYYLEDRFKPQREAYQAFLLRTLTMLGIPDAQAAAQRIYDFEHAIAERSWTAEDQRDISKLNNPMTAAELAAYAPGVDWPALSTGFGIGTPAKLIVADNTAVRDIAKLYAETPLDTLKLWQVTQTAMQAAPYLNQAWVDSRFQYVKTLSGVSSILPREKRAVALIDDGLGELIGQDYVRAYFPAIAKTKMQALVANLKVAMADRIRGNDWMGDATKQAALTKLSRMDVMVGYPDKFRSYAALKLTPGDLYGNVQKMGAFNYAYAIEDVGKPVDRKKWAMNPQTVNAYNGGLENKIVFPAGILQAPMFSPGADDAVNYGSIGAVIGHEISHGFDDQGRKVDATGAVRDWWTADDARRFEERAKVLGDQYGKFEAVPGVFVNPKLTMGENIADFAGLQVALDAYYRSLGGRKAPVLDGLTGDQRFFLAFAQTWRGKQREDAMRNQIATDPHSPRRFRLLGPVSNIQPWYDAFGVKPGDKMYIPPEKRAKIW
ncbi:MAG: M13 family metallopeptidase [Sphingomonadales bacterium]|nr:M13 family metallopeptidase [Sphingomonadales bacterium]